MIISSIKDIQLFYCGAILHLLLSLFLPASCAFAQTNAHPIIYPQLDPPFDQVINITIKGIRDVHPSAETHSYKSTIVSGDNPILLTNRAVREFNQEFEGNNNFVAGLAELRQSSPFYGVSFFIDPELYIQQILSLSSEVNKIVFFYNNARSDIPQLDNSLTGRQIELKTVSASSTDDAFKVLAEENSSANDRTAFVFVRGFIEINTNALLDFVIRETWSSGAMSVGNKASYVKAGMTIALLPDFREYGRQIADLMSIALDEEFRTPRINYLKTEVNAINVRTALRSNIFVNDRIKRTFNYSYPAN